MKLYELTGAWAVAVDAYEAAEDDEAREAALEVLEELESDITGKAEAYARIMKNLQADADGYKTEIDRLTKKKRASEAAVERLKARLLEGMRQVGAEKIQTGICAWRIQDNPWTCEVLDAEAVPQEWREPQPDRIDRRGLVEHFKATGEILPGVEFKRTAGLRFR